MGAADYHLNALSQKTSLNNKMQRVDLQLTRFYLPTIAVIEVSSLGTANTVTSVTSKKSPNVY